MWEDSNELAKAVRRKTIFRMMPSEREYIVVDLFDLSIHAIGHIMQCLESIKNSHRYYSESIYSNKFFQLITKEQYNNAL